MGEKGIDHQSNVDLITAGAIGRLLPKLGEFLNQGHNLQTSMKEDIESLEIQLRRMDNALCKMPREQQDQLDPQGDKHCAYKLRELSYDIEDIIDNLLLSLAKKKKKKKDNLLLSIDDASWKPMANQDSFRETLEDIKARVTNLDAWHADFVAKPTTCTVDPCLEDRFMQARQLVGIHKLKGELISRMSSSSRRLKIVSIFGAAGMGKTTLAKAVYDNIKEEFNCCAFVSVGQQPDMEKPLRDIIIDLAKEGYSDLNMTILDENGRQLIIDELQRFLEEKRFLIVFDDIRDILSWEVIKCALVDNFCGSRIITTSRVLGVTEPSGEVLKLMPLSTDASKELFYATLSGHKGTITFDQLIEQSTEYILQKCGGVPLAIIMIASLLAGKPQEEWTKVSNSIGFGQEDNIGTENYTRTIIQFSYYDLPSHLKTCLLYLSIFPDDHVIIEKDMLVWRWVAEGFVHDDQEQGESLFRVGERYLYELISRNMIQIVEHEDTNIHDCRVEAMVMEWIRTVAKEENFVTAVSGDWYEDHDQYLIYHKTTNARILAVHNSTIVLDKPHDLDRIIRVRSFNGTGCSISSRTLLHPSFQVLRVLSLEGCELTADDGSDGLKNLIAEPGLLHLRYLGLGGTAIQDLPTEIGSLRYLQTLDLTDTDIEALPHSVTELTQLKCFRCLASARLELPQDMGNLTLLEELWLGRVGRVDEHGNLPKELSKLTELRVLRIHTDTGYNLGGERSEALVESISKLEKIEVVELLRMDEEYIIDVYDYCGGRRGSQEPYHHVIVPGAFPKLRYLKIDTWLMYQPGAMPRLKSVELEVHVWAFKDANFDFHNFYKLSYLRLLEKVHIQINCWGAKMEEAEEVEAALRCALQSHPHRPKFVLTRFGQCEDDTNQKNMSTGQCEDDTNQNNRSTEMKEVFLFCQSEIYFLDRLKSMPLELLKKITNDFSEKNRLGSGTFGTVYKGVLNGKEVAVKLLHSMSQRPNYQQEFMKEFDNLKRLNHPNIVQLLGYCYEIKCECIEYERMSILVDKIYRALCFDYMHNGSLQQHLDDKFNRLDWPTCYNIIKGTCEGLEYLHEGSEGPMYHLDLKPGNILLDKNMVPKIADFGLSKLVDDNQTQATSSFLGTIRYCPPEYIDRNYVSNKFDIFSLGVVMIEIIAGPEGYHKAAEMPSQEYIDHVEENWRKRLQATSGCISQIYECRQVKRCIEIALQCISPDRKQRPNIRAITSWLNEIQNDT